MHNIETDIQSILGAERMRRIADLSRLRRAWPNMVGTMLASHSEPSEIHYQQDGSLHLLIAVNHSIMAQQIIFLRDEIRQACLKQCRLKKISRINTRVQPGAGIQVTTSRKAQLRHVSLSEKKAIARELQILPQRELRLAMFQARLAQLSWMKEQ